MRRDYWSGTLGGANRPPRQPGSTKLPPWILPHNEQHSIPDICQLSVSRNYQGPNLSIDAKRTGVIAIVEIKYAPDPDLNGTVRQLAVDQHTELRQSLLTHGWGKVDIYPVIIGNAGTITATADDALQALGVGTAARMTLSQEPSGGQRAPYGRDLKTAAESLSPAGHDCTYLHRHQRLTQMRPDPPTRLRPQHHLVPVDIILTPPDRKRLHLSYSL